jgi:nickel-type superoxide dismutase maturation protease
MLPLRRFRVADHSMRPTLEPGDYVLVNRWAYRFRPPSPGDLVVVEDPEVPTRFLVKRVSQATATGEVRLTGDNEDASRDSRVFGPVSREQIVGKVWLKLRQ